ncbi:MAG: YchF/TatD family DNA exonuclease, partial [Thermocrinis sp.]|nr:YchF/TatD family DNA exonuclease [Thermocrinis sp.]
PKVKALGEMGLDFYKEYSDRKKQEDIFRKQIQIARELGIPIVVHSRNAEEETYRILKEEKAYEVGGVMHCFTGSYEFMKKCVDLGFYISYSGIITYPNADALREVVKRTPTQRILLETDSPFLAPQPVRGKPNKPTNIWHTAEVMAKLIPNTNLEDVDRMTSENAKLIFNLNTNGKRETITYVINNKLYINLTNKCNLHCAFCQRERERNFMVKGYWVWVERDPSVEEVIREIGDPTKYEEIVFCGYGEPTLRFSALKEIARWVKSKGGRVRVDTNGLLFTFMPKESLKELVGLVDVWSVSLNAPDKETYDKVCKPTQPDAFEKVIEFIKTAKSFGFEVVATAVDYPGVDMKKTEELAKSLGAKWRARIYESVG